jgi:CHAD domain-containing protein
MSTEREVKLAVPPGYRVPTFQGTKVGSGDESDRRSDGVVIAPKGSERLQTTYVDTPDLRIARWGCSLRFRGGQGWTVKLPPATQGSAILRDEHLFPGGSARPPEAAVDLLRAYVRRAPIAPVAKLQTIRTTYELRGPSGEPLAEIVDDEVSVLDGRRVAARFREVEVEATDSLDPQGLEAIVDRLRAAGAGASTTTPKYLQALGPLAVGPPELVVRELDRSATGGDIVAVALNASAIRLLRNDAGVKLGEDPEAVHQARVATRRLRSDLRTYRSLLDPDWCADLREELRWLGAELGAVRDAEVLEGRLRASVASLPEVDATAAARLLRRLRDRRDGARTELLAERRSERYSELLDRLVDAANEPARLDEAARPAAEVLPGIMAGPWGHLRRAVDELDKDASNEQLHAARIRAKRIRYASESMIPHYGKRARIFAQAAAELQDVLGAHQDAVVAEAWLREAAAGAGARTAFVAGELAAREQRAAARARRAWPAAWKALSRKRVRFWL